jgi:AAA+ superfamily predicted ATPase
MPLEQKNYRVRIRLLEDLLGTIPTSKDVYARYIAAKGREMVEKDARKKGVPHAGGEEVTEESLDKMVAEETESVKELEEKGWTGQLEAPRHGNVAA